MIHKLTKPQWHPFFDNMTKILVGRRVEIETASLKFGDQIEAEWLPLIGIVYDPKDDVLEVALQGVDHLIYKPRDVFVDEEGGILTSFEVTDADGIVQIVKLKEPLMLPAPAH